MTINDVHTYETINNVHTYEDNGDDTAPLTVTDKNVESISNTVALITVNNLPPLIISINGET